MHDRDRPTADAELLARLTQADDPIVAFKARTLVLGESADSASLGAMRERIAASTIARDLVEHRQPERWMRTHAYQKWQGPHWTLTSLALIDYPPGDASLGPLFEQVHDWLFARRHLRPPSTAVFEGQEDRVRRCASQEGNAVWYSVRLGFARQETRALVDRLIAYQWPDGGWNCDKRQEARASSFQETAIPLRGLVAYWQATGYERARAAAERAAQLLLSRRLLWRRNGAPIRPGWGGPVDVIHFPIQFYDVLFALQVITEAGHVRDPRCAGALALLASKRLSDGGFPLEDRNAKRADRITSRGTWADWGRGGRKTANPLVTVEALGVLRAAGRFG